MEYSKIGGEGKDGVLHYKNERNETLFTIGASSALPFGAHKQGVSNITVATSLLASTHGGYVVTCSGDNIVVTLPTAATKATPEVFTLMNTASNGGALLLFRTNATTDYFLGGGAAATSACCATNTKLTQKYGDLIGVMSSGSVTWNITSIVGTWAFAATS